MTSYHERGHSLETQRGKNDSGMMRRIFAEDRDTVIEQIDNWQKENRHLKGSLQDFSDWWKGVWADFNDNAEEILEYLEGLCESCLAGKPGCECEQHFREYRRNQ